MRSRIAWCVVLSLLGAVLAGGLLAREGGEGPDREQVVIRWPSERYPSIQAAVDALPEGGKLLFRPGLFRIDEPLVIRKRIQIEGAGSRREEESDGRFTRLQGIAPRRLVDPPEAVGLLNYVGAEAGGLLSDLELTGFDAGVVSRGEADGTSKLTIRNARISATGRGLLAMGPIAIDMSASTIRDVLGNGISIVSPSRLIAPLHYNLFDLLVWGAQHSCIYVEDSFAAIGGSLLQNCGPAGGIAGVNASLFIADMGLVDLNGPGITLIDSGGSILDSTINQATGFGIVLIESTAYIRDNQILNTLPTAANRYGDGIAAQLSQGVTLVRNTIRNSHRAGSGVFGSQVSYEGTRMTCNAFDLVGEMVGSVNYTVFDSGDNLCGCPNADGSCILETVGIAPPVLVGNPGP